MDLLKPAEKIILVAGTNGKGSTVTYCSSVLSALGLSVGTYMSPHLHVYNERVKINGEMATDQDLVESFEAIELGREDITLTYFEVGTLSSLYLFKKYSVDCAVIEVGLGGRLDATNIVEPDVSVVTSVGLDHQDWLGDDLSIIAFEKAGVFRSGKPAICGQKDVPKTLIAHADTIAAKLLLKGRDYSVEVFEDSWSCHCLTQAGEIKSFLDMPLPQLPLENAGTALQALVQLYPDLTTEQVCKGFKSALLPGRMQTFSFPFKGMLDVGHNPQAAQLLAAQLSSQKPIGRRYALLAMLKDKDAEGVVSALGEHIDAWYLASLDGYRGQSASDLKHKVNKLVSSTVLNNSVEQALDALKNTVTKNDEVLVLGSFFTVAYAQNWLKEQLNG
jgi:dihydrofolate synthase/folylpolyglutamate synthase